MIIMRKNTGVCKGISLAEHKLTFNFGNPHVLPTLLTRGFGDNGILAAIFAAVSLLMMYIFNILLKP